jgi:hypothetical protein
MPYENIDDLSPAVRNSLPTLKWLPEKVLGPQSKRNSPRIPRTAAGNHCFIVNDVNERAEEHASWETKQLWFYVPTPCDFKLTVPNLQAGIRQFPKKYSKRHSVEWDQY